jgi:hypothetical protein
MADEKKDKTGSQKAAAGQEEKRGLHTGFSESSWQKEPASILHWIATKLPDLSAERAGSLFASVVQYFDAEVMVLFRRDKGPPPEWPRLPQKWVFGLRVFGYFR